MEKIRTAFKAYFEGDDIELPQAIKKKGHISKDRWGITYRLTKDDKGKPALEFVATHPLTNMRHVTITDNGDVIALDGIQEGYSYDPKIEGDKERAEKEWRQHNQGVVEDLEAKGLL